MRSFNAHRLKNIILKIYETKKGKTHIGFLVSKNKKPGANNVKIPTTVIGQK